MRPFATAGSHRRALLVQLALCVPELSIASGLGFAVGASVCDSAGGLAVVVPAMAIGVVIASAYVVIALVLGLTGRRRALRARRRESSLPRAVRSIRECTARRFVSP